MHRLPVHMKVRHRVCLMLQTLHMYGYARLQAGMRERHAHAWTTSVI